VVALRRALYPATEEASELNSAGRRAPLEELDWIIAFEAVVEKVGRFM
jgi:hypothetical protein